MRRSALGGVVLAILLSAWSAGAAAAATGPVVVGATSGTTSLSGVTSVAVSGNFAYAASYWSGQLNVLDISNPAAPTLVATTPSSPQMTDATNVTISGGFAFVTSKNRNGTCNPGPIPSCALGSNDDGTGNSLTVVNISNPLAPSVVGSIQDPAHLFGAYAVAVSGHYAFIASQGLLSGQPTTPDTSMGSFSVVDLNNLLGGVIANIDNSSLTGALANGLDHATSVAISGNDAYVTAFYGARLTTIDILNPAAPVVVATHHDPPSLASPNDVVVVNGSHAYVVNQANTMELADYDISNPAAVALVGTLTDPKLSGAYRVRVSPAGNLLYVSGNNASSVAAIDISNPSAPRLAGAVTDPHLANVDGLAVGSTGRYLVATAPDLSSEHGATYPPFPLQTGGPTNTGTVSVIDLEPSPLSVSIAPASKPANPTSQRSASFSFAVTDTVATVQCSLDHGAFGPCSTPTTAGYSSLGLGPHTFTVDTTGPAGDTAQDTYSWTIVAGPPPPPPPPPGSTAPKNTSAPIISGTPQEGQRLTAGRGAWSGNPAPTYHYQWERCNAQGQSCKSISNQVGNTYTVTLADVGSRLVVAVRATNVVGSATATSAGTKIVKWSSSAFASATLNGSKTTHPGITLSIPSPGNSLKLTKLVISLPKGISFAATKRALAARISVKDQHRKRVAFTAALSHGKLTLTFKHPPTTLKLTIARGLLSISRSLEGRIKSGKAKTEKISLTLTYAGTPSRQGSMKFRLS